MVFAHTLVSGMRISYCVFHLIAGMHERLNDVSSDEDYPDSDLLAFNVEMGMVPMSSINSSGVLATESTDAPGALPRPRRARLNSHSVPLGKIQILFV